MAHDARGAHRASYGVPTRLPILIFREHGVLADGMLESGVVGQYMPEFNLDNDPDISGEWLGIMGRWQGFARSVVEHRGRPPQMY